MLVPWTVPLLLLAAYVLLASAAISDKSGLLCARQHPAQLHFHEHRFHQQQMSLHPALELASPKWSRTVAVTSPSFMTINITTSAQDSRRTNSTQLAHDSNSLWNKDSRPGSSPGKSLNDGLISGVENLDISKEDGDLEEASIEQEHNDAANASDEEECPIGFETLYCEDCGGPENTWEVNPWHFHCRGIEAQRYKWKDCYCINPDPDRGPCTFDNRAEETCEDDTHEEVSNSPGKNEDTEEISVDGQQNVLDASDNEDCPRGVDTLDCEDCGGPEQTWDRIHCKGIEEEDDRWKDRHCLNWKNARGPRTFDYNSDDTSNDRLAVEEELQDSTNETGYLDETSIEQQLNDATNAPDDEECPTDADTLDCEDCGGPEQTWETSHNDYHCKGIEAERYRWKDCYCVNWEGYQGPCRFGQDRDEDDFPNLPDLPSPSVDSSDSEDLVDKHGDANGEPANDEVLLESTAERAAALTEE